MALAEGRNDLANFLDDDGRVSLGSGGSAKTIDSFDTPKADTTLASPVDVTSSDQQFAATLESNLFVERPFVLQPVTFQLMKVILKYRRQFLSSLWKALLDKLTNYSLEDLASFEEEANKVLNEMERIGVADLSSLRQMVSGFFANIRKYDAQRSQALEINFVESQQNLIKEKRDQLEAFAAEESEFKTKVEDFQQQLDTIVKNISYLKKERKRVRKLIDMEKDKISNTQANIVSLNSEVARLQEQSTQNDVFASNLKALLDLVKTCRSELESFKLFP